ncbi:hypothetical protein B296_00043192 [Ensete ventricosum]|uniref:Uncharacterized protein n=1 Tax=Ensete ventricosum TaxID=4639 RepID=A0A426YIC1_ENSVE|nr:hypothetical protein B296_00043192 [Ensete ventricosum]
MARLKPHLLVLPSFAPPSDLLLAPLQSVFSEQVEMTSSDSSSSIRIVPSPGSRGIGLGEPEASSSGVSSGPPSLIDARILRNLEVMKAGHDLDTAVTEGSLAAIRERYSITTEYGLHVQRLDWPTHLIGNVPLYLSEEESVLVNKLKGILSSSCAIKEMIELWLVEAVLSPASMDRMDLGDLHGMSKVSKGKTSSVRAAVPAREVSVSPVREAPKTFSKKLIDTPTEQIDDLTRWHKKVKILSRRHKSHHGEGGSRSHSKGKEPTAPVEEPETLVESDEEDASPVHHRPRSMKDLFKMKVQKDAARYYTLYMSDLAHQDPDKEMQARWGKLKNSTKVWNDPFAAEEFERELLHPQLAWEFYTLPSEVLLARAAKEMMLMALFDRVHDAGRLITFMDYHITNLQQEIDALKYGGGPEAITTVEECASKLEKELKKTKRERDEALQ